MTHPSVKEGMVKVYTITIIGGPKRRQDHSLA
jgi:hypothetical protein